MHAAPVAALPLLHVQELLSTRVITAIERVARIAAVTRTLRLPVRRTVRPATSRRHYYTYISY